MLARQKARQNERQHLKAAVQPPKLTNSVSSTLNTHTDNKVGRLQHVHVLT